MYAFSVLSMALELPSTKSVQVSEVRQLRIWLRYVHTREGNDIEINQDCTFDKSKSKIKKDEIETNLKETT